MGVGAARRGQVFGLRICCFGIWLLLGFGRRWPHPLLWSIRGYERGGLAGIPWGDDHVSLLRHQHFVHLLVAQGPSW